MEKFLTFLVGSVAYVVTLVVTLAAFTYVLQLCWNGVIPDISSLPPLGFWQSFYLLMLIRILCYMNLPSKS